MDKILSIYEELRKNLTDEEMEILEKKGLNLKSNLFDPKYDVIFKAILTSPSEESKKALLSLLSSILQRKIVKADLANNELSVGGITQKQSVMDIHCVLDDNSEVNIEMAMCGTDNYVNVSEYRVCKLFGEQEIKGKTYDDLNKVYGIMILNFTLFHDRKEFFDEYMYRNMEGRILSGNTQIIYLELTKLDEVIKKPVSDMTGAEKWAVFWRYGNDPGKKDLIDEIRRSEEGIAMGAQVLESISSNQKERINYVRFMMNDARDTSSRIYMERRARQEGMIEGEKKGKIEIARKMLRRGVALEYIAEDTELPVEKIQELAQSIQ